MMTTSTFGVMVLLLGGLGQDVAAPGKIDSGEKKRVIFEGSGREEAALPGHARLGSPRAGAGWLQARLTCRQPTPSFFFCQIGLILIEKREKCNRRLGLIY